MPNKPDIRRVEAEEIVKAIARRDPVCMRLFIGLLERYIVAHPQIGAKDLLAAIMVVVPPSITNVKEKEFLCPNLSQSMTEERPSNTGPADIPKNAVCLSSVLR